MIISYFTAEYFDGAKIFVESLYLTNKDQKVLINSRNATKKQIEKLKNINNNLIVLNKELSIETLAKKNGISKELVENSKNGCIADKKTGHRLGMNLIADGDRINSYLDVLNDYPNEEFYIFFDIDLMFRKSLDKTFKRVMENDVGLKLRAGKGNKIPKKLNLNGKNKDALINIGTVAIINNSKGRYFIEKGVHHVNRVSIKEKTGLKWGQYAIACAYNDCSDTTNYGKFQNGTFSPYLKEEAPVGFFKKKQKNEEFEIAKKELNVLRKK